MRPKVNSATKRFLFDHVWGLPYHRRTEDAFTQQTSPPELSPEMSPETKVFYLRETGSPHSPDSPGLTSSLSWSSLPGLQWLVRARGDLVRAGWASVWLLTVSVSLLLCLLALLTLTDETSCLRRLEPGLPRPFPPLVLCPGPGVSPGQQRRDEVESLLPVMSHLWQTWAQLTAGLPASTDHLPWRNETAEMKELLARVMFEGGRLAAPDCQDLLSDCRGLQHNKIFTEKGLCLEISAGREIQSNLTTRNIEDFAENNLGRTEEHDFKQEFINQKDILEISVRLQSDSLRLGHPVVSLKHWGDSNLCDTQWSQQEARVMCRELGFSSGVKFYPAETQAGGGVSYAPLLGRFLCSGSEQRLTDCEREQLAGDSGDCRHHHHLSLLLCDVAGLHGVHRSTKVRGFPFLAGSGSGPEYFCQDDFTHSAAAVFCRMLGWRSGRVSGPGPATQRPGRQVKCSGSESHILDCESREVTGCPAVTVDCDPGFPLTTRLHQAGAARELGELTGGRAGYPVVDTTGRLGLLCSAGTDLTAVNMICRMLGLKHGLKLPAGFFGSPSSSSPPYFVFEAVRCLGNESSVFDCDLSPWGVEGCHQDDILAVLCSDDRQLLRNFTVSSTESQDLRLTDKISNFLGIANTGASWSSPSRVVPHFNVANLSLSFCLTSRFAVPEASLLCRHLGFQCGAPDFSSSGRTENSGEQLYVEFSCPLESRCEYDLTASCLHTARLLCYSSCPPALSLSLSPPAQTWQLELRENVSSSLELYLDSVNILNRVSPGSRVRVATTIIAEEGEEKEVAGRDRTVCLRRLLAAVCGCLAWHHNYRLLQPNCVGQVSSDCSQSVSRLWWSVGGDCSTAVQLATQILRVQLEEGQICGECEGGDSLTYHITQDSGSSSPNTLTIIKDHQASSTFIRVKHQSWLSLAATFGGLWSLLTGISVLSILELFYWAMSNLVSHNQRKGFRDSRVLFNLSNSQVQTDCCPEPRPRKSSESEVEPLAEGPAFALVDTGEVQDVLVITDLTQDINDGGPS